jgi:glucosamine-6-phosphate deaminase
MREFVLRAEEVNRVNIHVSQTKAEMGRKAAFYGAGVIRSAIRDNGKANIILATGASQFEMLESLAAAADIDWSRVEAFHLDEYAGMSIEHPASFRKYLKERFVEKIPAPIGAFHYINAEADLKAECGRLGAQIIECPIDVAFIGIGENGHLAFNDPPADFVTTAPYIVVELDEACRAQQLGEGWFPSMDAVPKHAISMSIRQIMDSRVIVCSVPDARKAVAVKNAVNGLVTPSVPASILQQHGCATLFLDDSSGALIA